MDNGNLATVIADTLVCKDLIGKNNFDEAVEAIEDKLCFHLGEDRGAAFFESQHITNECTQVDSGTTATSEFDLENGTLSSSSLVGTIYRKRLAIQTFAVDEKGNFTFNNVGQPSDVMALSGTLNLKSGKVKLAWNTAPGDNHMVVSYDHLVAQKEEPVTK